MLLMLGFASGVRALTSALHFRRSVSLDAIRELSWKQFEDVIGEFYRRKGYNVREQLGGGADGGVDLTLHKGGERTWCSASAGRASRHRREEGLPRLREERRRR
jgi:restriction endonuclease Mrr